MSSPPPPSSSAPSSSSTSKAVAKRSQPSTSLMQAPALQPPTKRIKRAAKVLEEDTYEAALEHIIRRDFFPGLAESDAQREYLAARDSGDASWIAEAGRALRDISTPGNHGRKARDRLGGGVDGKTPITRIQNGPEETPRGWKGETPVAREGIGTDSTSVGVKEHDGNSTEPVARDADTTLSLSDFQHNYTSEDNESFYKLLDRSNSSRASKHAYLWSGTNKLPSSRQLEEARREQKLLEARAAETAVNGRELARIDLPDTRPAAPDTWRAKPDNGFMFAPAGVDDELGTQHQRREERSLMGEKRIVHENTRMPPPPPRTQQRQRRQSSQSFSGGGGGGGGSTNGGSVPASPSLSAVRAAVAGRPRLSDSEMGSVTGGETPRVNGWAFVDSEEPEPEDEEALADGDSHIIDLGPGDATPNPFNIRQTRSREALHHRMVERMGRARETKRLEKISNTTRTPVPRFPNGPRVAMSPAAQRLLAMATPKKKSGGSSVGGGGNTLGRELKGSVGGGATKLGDGWASATSTPRSRPSLAGVTPVKK